MRAANYSCYLGYCRKIVFSDIFFVLIFFGPEWEINSFSVSSVKIGNSIFKKRKKEIFYIQPFIGKSLWNTALFIIVVGQGLRQAALLPCPLCPLAGAKLRPGSGTLANAFQQLHPDGNADMPAQWDQPDEAGNDGGPQQVLDYGGSVRVSVEDLKRERIQSLSHQGREKVEQFLSRAGPNV